MIMEYLWGPDTCNFALVAFNSVEVEAETKVGCGVCIQYLHSK